MMDQGLLLYCPHCRYTEKPQVLGRLLSNGDLLILRFHSGTSLMRAYQYSLTCACGFTFLIKGTQIEGTLMREL